MTIVRILVVVLALVAVTACTVERTPEAGRSQPASSGPAASSARPCPWSEARGQEYEPETGRVKLVVTCLSDQQRAGGGGWIYGSPDGNQSGERRYADGTSAAVLCVDPAGGRFTDGAGHASTVWFRVNGTFADGDGEGWVPHVATGYARAEGQDPCPPR
jgi:hypothetical protein